MLEHVITLTCIGYLSFSYTQYAEDTVNWWLLFSLRGLCVIMESSVIYYKLHQKYQRIVYDDSDYEPTQYQRTMYWFLTVTFYSLLLALLTLSVLFLMNAKDRSGVLMFQAISLLIILMILVLFMKDGFSDFSGDAFCEHLDCRNTAPVERSFLPFSLAPDVMKIYKDSLYLPK